MMKALEPKTVGKLEDKLLHAIADILLEMGLKRLPLLPNHRTMHLMAKAAVTVYECAVENQSDDSDH